MCKFFDPQNDWLYIAFASFNLWNINGLGFRVEMPLKFLFHPTCRLLWWKTGKKRVVAQDFGCGGWGQPRVGLGLRRFSFRVRAEILFHFWNDPRFCLDCGISTTPVHLAGMKRVYMFV